MKNEHQINSKHTKIYQKNVLSNKNESINETKNYCVLFNGLAVNDDFLNAPFNQCWCWQQLQITNVTAEKNVTFHQCCLNSVYHSFTSKQGGRSDQGGRPK